MHMQIVHTFFCTLKNNGITVHKHMQAIYYDSVCFGRQDCLRARATSSIARQDDHIKGTSGKPKNMSASATPVMNMLE